MRIDLTDRGYLRRVDSAWRARQKMRAAMLAEALRQLAAARA